MLRPWYLFRAQLEEDRSHFSQGNIMIGKKAGAGPATAPWSRAFDKVCDGVVNHHGEHVLSERCRDILLGAITEQDRVTDYEVEDLSDGSAQLRIWIPCDDGKYMVIAIKVESQDSV
jgi:hypothetical protein